MALKTYNPTTPGQRGLILVDRSALHKGKPVKTLTEGLTKSGGRNNAGRITARRRGGGHKRSYRIIDFKRRKWDIAATVEPPKAAIVDPANVSQRTQYVPSLSEPRTSHFTCLSK